MNLKKVLYISYGLVGACLALMLSGAVLKSILVMVLSLLLAIGYLIFNRAKWRCTHCGKHLGRDRGKFCPHRGHHLVDLE